MSTLEKESIFTKGNVGDFVFYDSANNKFIAVGRNQEIGPELFPESIYSIIGVVVIPTAHDVYVNGQCAIRSIKNASFKTPDEGTVDVFEYIKYGQNTVDLSLINFDVINVCDNTEDGSIRGVSDSGYFPIGSYSSDESSWMTMCKHDNKSYYTTTSATVTDFIPSPYLNDGSRNPGYHQDSYPSSSKNMLSDFNGKGNTSTLTIKATAQSDWKTANRITNNGGEGYSPAACACWRFHTIGTNQGDWYLPAAGELGYMFARVLQISSSLNKIRESYGSEYTIGGITSNISHISSTEIDKNNCFGMDSNYAIAGKERKNENLLACPFTRVTISD